MATDTDLPRRLFTVDEYHRLAEAGIFHPDERLELIEGEIIEMSRITPAHAGCVINANRLFFTRLGERMVLSPQNPVAIRPRSEPQPDLTLLRPREVSYSEALPTPQDVLLAVEVADTTVRFDRLVKARLYARAGIGEFWLLLPNDRAVEIHRGPGPDGYARVTHYDAEQLVAPLAFPDASFVVSEFFV